MRVYLNGEFIDEAQACISIHDRGFLYGDGVFETCRWRGRGFFRFSDHMRRLSAGAAALKLTLPAEDELFAAARTLAEELKAEDAAFRVTVTRGAVAGAPTVLATVQPLAVDWAERAAQGWKLITARTRHPAAGHATSHIKSIGRLHGLLARLEAQEAGADDALLLSADEHVVEGPTWNVFWVRGQELFTPSLESGVLEGVTRDTLLGIAEEVGYHTREGIFSRTEIDTADEIFASMTSSGLVRIHTVDDRQFPRAGATAWHQLFSAYWNKVAREVA